ncbi:hypothetical protein B0H19DRAFT_1076244 [Mycena capillaripes]|nr:hypothetical protein B0H19DRAFT_1076244 [Mycena capillaripes]
MPPRKKQKRNLTGLRNQRKNPSPPPEDFTVISDDESAPGVHFDSMQVDWENDNESDIESELDLDDFDDEEFSLNLVEMAEKEEVKDLDWVPSHLQVKLKERKERPQHYNTTADSMNKALSSAYRHAAQFKNQKLLDSISFNSSRPPTSTLPLTSKKIPAALEAGILNWEDPSSSANTPGDSSDADDVEIISAPASCSSSPIIYDEPVEPLSPQIPATRRASRSPSISDKEILPISEPVSSAAPSDFEDFVPLSKPVSSAAASNGGGDVVDREMTQAEEEREQQEEASSARSIYSWEEVRTKIKADLKKKSNILPLSRINQLMIVCNFATLRIKGTSRIQAGDEIARQWHEGKGHCSSGSFLGSCGVVLDLHDLGFMMSRLKSECSSTCGTFQQAK